MNRRFKYWSLIWLIAVMPVFLGGCSLAPVAETEDTIPKPDDIPPHEVYTAPRVDLKNYKSVQTRDGQDKAFALAVAISGGGERAANYGVGILLGLEDIHDGDRNALNEVDYFSTVSGGGFAAALYVSELYYHLKTCLGNGASQDTCSKAFKLVSSMRSMRIARNMLETQSMS